MMISSAARAGQHHVHAPRIGEETHVAVGVCARAAKNDHLLLSPLESVDGANLEGLERVGIRGASNRLRTSGLLPFSRRLIARTCALYGVTMPISPKMTS